MALSIARPSDADAAHELAALIGLEDGAEHSEPVRRAAAGLHIDAHLARRLRHNPAFGLRPGDVVHYDYRGGRDAAADAARDASREVRLVEWNIERGYKLSQIINLLREQDADVISLQEVDIGCARSEWADTGRIIAEALQMNYTFVTEFIELYSPMRPAESQGGGVHGNAILSRYDHTDTHALLHEYEHFHWETRGHEKREPRLGRRYTLVSRVSTHAGEMDVYSTHLEVFSGVLGRLRNFAEILDHARGRYSGEKDGCAHQAILGDFNTLAHGIARFSPHYCTDALRWGSLGYTEAEWWTRHVLTRGADSPPQLDAWPCSSSAAATILPASSRASLVNPGFYCPFDAYEDVTLTNYRGWFNGKLDWMLLRNLTHTSHWLSNDDYAASDHRLLACSVTFDEPLSPLAAAAATAAAAAAAQAVAATATAAAAHRGSSSPVWPVGTAEAASAAAADSPATPGSGGDDGRRTLRSRHQNASDSSSSSRWSAGDSDHVPSDLRVYATKNSSSLRKLMPLTRPSPGLITSSAVHAHVYVSQIGAFWLAVAALLFGVTRIAGLGQ